MSIELDEGTLPRQGAPDLYYASAMPAGTPKAVVGIIHGYADHGARYRHVMGAFAEHGIGSVAIDLRGHGRALGSRGFCERFDEFLVDAREVRRLISERNVPTFLFGHSFGGLVASSSVLDDPGKLKGLILSAPFFGLALEVPKVKVLAGRVASRVYPRLGLPSGLAGKDMSHDPAKAKEYDQDPLVFKNATARWFTETTKAQERATNNAPRLALPIYCTFGTADKVASLKSAKRFFDLAGSTDKTWDPKDNLFHEVLNEPSWKELADTMASWMLKRI